MPEENRHAVPFEEDEHPDWSGADSLIIDIEGYEGPLDLLLAMARDQKVDLARLSILALAEQYLRFIENARKLRLELAADYLVMAAWVAYLKSRLLLPETEDDDEPSGEELAAALAFRLKRLEAMREAGGRLLNRDRLGRNRFVRGDPEPVVVLKSMDWDASLYNLLEAYGSMRQRQLVTSVRIERRTVIGLKEARERLVELIGSAVDWTPIESFLTEYLTEPGMLATVRASSLNASLELVKEGRVDLRQSKAFAPVYLRLRECEDNVMGTENA